jgi:hypothetical protein
MDLIKLVWYLTHVDWSPPTNMDLIKLFWCLIHVDWSPPTNMDLGLMSYYVICVFCLIVVSIIVSYNVSLRSLFCVVTSVTIST